jgi:LacI family transcriptional regulator
MVLADSRGDPDRAVEAVELLRGHGVDGIISTPPESDELNELLVSLRARGLPIVGIGLRTDPPVIDVATVDTRSGTSEAIRHLLDLGHQRIAMIGSRTMARGRRDAYRATLRSAKLPVRPELQRFGPLHRDTGVTATRELLALDDPPTAIFAANDSVALGVLQEAARQHISVPRQLSVIGFDDGDLAEHASPPLTTVAQPKAELGRRAVDLLVARAAATASSPPIQIDLRCELVIRASTARPAKRNMANHPRPDSKEASNDHTRHQ